MPLNTKFPGPGHAKTAWAELQLFGTALTKRWQKETALAYCDLKPIATAVTKHAGASGALDWEYLRKLPVKYHAADCEFRDWASSTDLDAPQPTCKGMIAPGVAGVYTDTDGTAKSMSSRIDCPVPHLMKMVPNWAAAECAAVWKVIPYFDAQNQSTIGAAHASLEEIQNAMNLHGATGKGQGGAGQLPDTVRALGAGSGDDKDWWVEWTGLAADTLREGFLSSPEPTLHNHYLIATDLARLVNNRAAIIELGRNNSVCLIRKATEALGEVTTTVNETDAHWKVLTGVAMALGLVSGGFTAAAAGTLEVGVFLAEAIIGKAKIPMKAFGTDFKKVVTDLGGRFKALNQELETQEGGYAKNIGDLRSTVDGIGSFDLELYDFGENSSTTPTAEARQKAKRGGFTANPTTILNLAKRCAWAAQDYDRLVAKLGAVVTAEIHLTDKDGKATDADKAVVKLSHEFREYMATTGARYLNARDQIAAAAHDYQEADDEASTSFDQTWDNWKKRDTESTFQPTSFKAEEADDTVRPDTADDDPYSEPPEHGLDPREVYETEDHRKEGAAR